MIAFPQRVLIFKELGRRLSQYLNDGFPEEFENAINQSFYSNKWFTIENIRYALNSIAQSLTSENLGKWLMPYNIPSQNSNPAPVAVIMAGNIPLVGFHDFLCVLISGNVFMGKLSYWCSL